MGNIEMLLEHRTLLGQNKQALILHYRNQQLCKVHASFMPISFSMVNQVSFIYFYSKIDILSLLKLLHQMFSAVRWVYYDACDADYVTQLYRVSLKIPWSLYYRTRRLLLLKENQMLGKVNSKTSLFQN